ncbi:hypothetical protein GCK72_008372 [Caenorhabditis remanei]|uniref:Sdz-33 F-box domain-containing protein n=1 Tax=Caenorhabditis remanei TaxID=31234 RepID=A0A6A5H037_CAERE|nr:hypothetical protein GCK72_008372 [Caenorhabditis remanei]KAF1760126.1 hypothetical protein GCK72_008372 [Caenorhabditis remanei]
MSQPPDRRLTYFTQHQRVAEWLQSITRPDGMQFLDMDGDSLLVFMKRLDRKTRSNLEQSCKILLSLSRSEQPHVQQLLLHFTTTWNHDQFTEITAQFSPEHTFHAVFLNKKKSPNFVHGGWSSDRMKNITSGTFPTEKLRLNATFVSRTSKYIEYWLKNFQIDTLKIKVENLIPGKENDIQQMNYIGPIPGLRLKKLIIHGSNNIRFINNWLSNLIPNIVDPSEPSRKTIDVEFIDVAKLDQIFHHPVMTSGKVNLTFHRVNTHFTRKTLNYINSPRVNITVRQVPSDTVNVFLKRWIRGEMVEDFQYLHITETTQWPRQEIQLRDAFKGIRYQKVDLNTDVPLRILQIHNDDKIEKEDSSINTSTSSSPSSPTPSSSSSSHQSRHLQIYQITGPRPAFCVHSHNQFIFEVPTSEQIQMLNVSPPMIQNTFNEYERQKNRIYMELFRKRLIRLFN